MSRLRLLLPLLWCLMMGAALPAAAAPPRKNSPVNYQRLMVNGVRAYVVTVDLNCRRIQLVPESSNGHYKSFRRFIGEGQPVAAINGTFFDPATATIICNLISGGRLLSEGRVGHSLRIDRNNRAQLVTTAGKPGRLLENLSQWAFGISGGPTLLRGGNYALSPWSEGFRDPGLLGIAPRSAIGITANNKLLLVTVRRPVRLVRLSWMMKSLGAKDAMNLDGGSSTALYYKGQYVARPRRMLTNIVAVYLRPASPSMEAMSAQAELLKPDQHEAPIYDAVASLPLALKPSTYQAPVDPDYLARQDPEAALPPE